MTDDSISNTREVKWRLFLFFHQIKQKILILFLAAELCLENHGQVDKLDWSNGKLFSTAGFKK